MSIIPPFKEVRQCLAILEKKDRRKYLMLLVLQAGLGLLDLVGVAILGIIGSLAIRGIQSAPAGERVNWILKILKLSGMSLQSQVAILGLMSVSALIVKTLANIYFSRKILFFLSNRTTEISTELTSSVFLNPKLGIQSQNSHEIQYLLGPGISAITVGVLGSASTVLSDLSLLLILGIGLFTYDPVTALTLFLIFSLIAIALYFFMFKKARKIATDILQFNVTSNKILFEAIQTYREIYVRNRRAHYINAIVDLKQGIANAQAEQAFLPNVSKYAVEITLIIGAILLSAILFISQDASHAFAGLALFLASGSRIGPSLLRLQQSLIQIQSSFVGAVPAIAMMSKIKGSKVEHKTSQTTTSQDFEPLVEVEAVTFRYPGASSDAIRNVSLRIKPGSSLALVGPSGGGKSTLIDLILGIQDPTEGKILVSGLPPSHAVANWPGRMGYVPQDVRMIDLSIRENIALGFLKNEISEEKVQEALRIAKLEEFVRLLPLGLDTEIGEFGAKISGGQRQRLGIARALYTSPKLLILDEATSALDGQTELEVSDAIKSLKNKVTLILVAHRLSTVRDADVVAYLEGGSIIATGSFDVVRSQVPNFDLQADLMGL